jgi:hypothetical protein
MAWTCFLSGPDAGVTSLADTSGAGGAGVTGGEEQ